MSLWSNLLDTHEVIKPATGLIPSGAPDDLGNPVLKALLPLYHTTLKVTIDVALDEHGNLCAPIEKNKEWAVDNHPMYRGIHGKVGDPAGTASIVRSTSVR